MARRRLYHPSASVSPVVVLPAGTLTFVLTDLEGSTRTWDTRPLEMREAMVRHDEIVYGAVQRHAGTMVESGRAGDSVLAVFRTARDAASCALELQRAFRAAEWPGGLDLKVRIALHTGEVELRGGHYFGPPLNRCARVLALCHGGQILATQATVELLTEDPLPDLELSDLGLHKLKDLRRSERVHQLTDRTRPERFPPLHARPAYRTNLPILLTSFVGRQRELDELRRLMRTSRLLTLTGTGGSGKTRLAKQLAVEVADEVAGGAWFVELAPVSDPRLVARAVANTLDVEEQPGRPLIETLVEHCAERAMLLLLDNCEHLLLACAALATTLLASCPQLRIVATSREALNVGGEVTWRVPPLAGADAQRLFFDRARSRAGGLAPTDANTRAIDAICHRLDGIPLAIELAAARTAMMPLDEILRRLDRGLAVLTGGDRTASKRQQTLEAAIDWSYELLSEGERSLLRRLSIFAGHFSLDAAEAVCADEALPADSILEHLSQLVAKSLVQPVDDQYACLATIRAYARAKLAATDETAALRRAHATYFLDVARSRRPGALAAWLDRLEQDIDDLREALQWCVSADPQMGVQFAVVLYEFGLLRGYTREARALLEALLAALPASSADRPRVMLDLGVFAYTAGDFEVASARISEGLAGARAADDRELLSRGLVFQGNVALAAGQTERAKAALDEALTIARETRSARREAEALHHLGSLALVRGDRTHAHARFTQSLERRRSSGMADETGTTLMLRAFVSVLRSDLASARRDIVEALEICLALRDRHAAAWSLDVLACLAALDGEAGRAISLAGAAHAAFESTAQRPPAIWRELTAPIVAGARASLGPGEAEAAWDRGRALDFERALHYALAGEGERERQLRLPAG